MSRSAINDLVIWQEIPQDWQKIRLKFVARFAYGDSLPSGQREEGEVPVYGSNGIVGYHDIANALSPAVIVGRKGSFGKVTYSEFPSFAIDTTYFIDSRYSKQSLRWLYYALQTLELDKLSQDTGVPGLSRENAYEYYLGLPPDDVQKAIASFLDRKTAAIDTLITKKQRLIQLLEEKRTALINQAVTKGLNPNAPMKDSGIPWIGKIPKHWEILHLKRVITSSDYGISNPLEPNGIYFVLRMGNLQNGEIVMDDVKYVNEVDPQLILKPNDILFNRTNSFDLVGKVALFRGNYDSEITFASYLVRFRTNKLAVPEYLVRFLARKEVQQIARSTALPAIGQVNLNPNRYGYLRICLPPLSEQTEIVTWLKDKESALQEPIKKIKHQIQKMGEYRQSLITAAVTGKIDVSQEVAA